MMGVTDIPPAGELTMLANLLRLLVDPDASSARIEEMRATSAECRGLIDLAGVLAIGADAADRYQFTQVADQLFVMRVQPTQDCVVAHAGAPKRVRIVRCSGSGGMGRIGLIAPI